MPSYVKMNPYEIAGRTRKVNKVLEVLASEDSLRMSIPDAILAGNFSDESWSLLERIANVHPLSEHSRNVVRVIIAAERA